jgi:hypothetical protein
MEGSEARNLATRLATSNTESALLVAREIADAWYGCQALAWVARFASESQVDKIAKMALNTASKAQDPFNYVGSAAWPIRALVERDHLKQVSQFLPELLRRAQDITLLASRSEALFLLFQAVRPCSYEMWYTIFVSLVAASSPLLSWRQGRNLRDALLMIAGDYPQLAEMVLDEVADDRLNRHIRRRLAAREFIKPRPFFWNKAA